MRAEVIQGECLVAMQGMADCSIDACVTDPPYGLSFMGKKWDYNVPSVEIFAEIYRTLKDGSRLLCFGGTRTMHRMWVNIEDAGFTIEDSIMWIYGSGFPKHKSKLKPAYEPICVARKGASTALNVDECRVAGEVPSVPQPVGKTGSIYGFRNGEGRNGEMSKPHLLGRWPANIILDEVAADMLNVQSGVLTSGDTNPIPYTNTAGKNVYGKQTGIKREMKGDTGGASRFFYCAKASRSERDAGLEAFDVKHVTCRPLSDDVGDRGIQERLHGRHARNHHPTVKPVALMRYLCRLVTPKDGLILDPFAGSGTTGIAAQTEGYSFIGIETDAEYCEIAQARMKAVNAPLFGNIACGY